MRLLRGYCRLALLRKARRDSACEWLRDGSFPCCSNEIWLYLSIVRLILDRPFDRPLILRQPHVIKKRRLEHTEGFCECVGLVIGFVQLLTLNRRCFLESLTGFFAYLKVSRPFKSLGQFPGFLVLNLPVCVPNFCIRNAFAAAIN